MSPNIYFPPPRPTLKLVRASSGDRVTIKPPEPAAEPELPAPSVATAVGDAALEAAWRKLHRASELMEAEERHLRDERVSLQALEAELKRREETLALRETRVAERERLIAAATPLPSAPAESETTASRLTRAPMGIARAILGSR